GDGPGTRQRLGLRGAGPQLVITDLGLLRPDPVTAELTLTHLHPGVTLAEARAATGWALAAAPDLDVTDPPSPRELAVLRDLVATKEAR
ncbi:MAG TPA: hypothetical protein VE152_12820, partial [Acidimicrobiales bacterium]|nr:hypothetical protein [Acidimicrobiales bacterium]